MSNILVCKNYKITDHSKWYDDRTNEENLVDNYIKMQDLCVKSAQENIIDLDTVKIFTGEADNIRDVFKKNFFEIYELWQEGHNILYADLDVVFTQPVNYFSDYNHFAMFNFTDPPRTTDEHYNLVFDHYFNCGIRYYPEEMDQSIWDKGIQMMENWNPERWDSEQIIYNAMLWSQEDVSPQDVWKPQLAYQMLLDPTTTSGNSINKNFNKIDHTQAGAIHVHGSRGSKNRLDLMQALLDGTLEPVQDEVLYL